MTTRPFIRRKAMRQLCAVCFLAILLAFGAPGKAELIYRQTNANSLVAFDSATPFTGIDQYGRRSSGKSTVRDIDPIAVAFAEDLRTATFSRACRVARRETNTGPPAV